MKDASNNHRHEGCQVVRPWHREPFLIVAILILTAYFLHLFLSASGAFILTPLFDRFFGYLRLAWWAVFLGLLIGALIEALVPEELMANLLAEGRKSILIAVALGFLASACSHGILAIAVSLYKKGASTASTLAFLLAAPWANLAITILLLALFGIKALFVIGGALLIAIIAGFAFQALEGKGMIEGRGGKGSTRIKSARSRGWCWPGWSSLIRRVRTHMWYLAKMVVWWILLGFFLASALGAFIPEHVFHRFFGPSLLGMLATLILASLIEVCSEGSAPLALELFQKTGAFGNAFVFLMAGVATDFTEIGIIWTNIGKRATVALVVVTVPLILLLGFLFNNLLR